MRAAEYDLPAGLVAALDVHLRAHAAGRPPARHARRGRAHPRGVGLAAARRADRPDPRLAGAPQRPLRTPLRHGAGRVPAARRRARTGRRPRRSSPSVRARGRAARRGRRRRSTTTRRAPTTSARPPRGSRPREEDLVLLAMFGDEAETLLQTIRQRHSREASLLVGDVDAHARRADPRARPDRPGVGRRGDRDRGRGHAGLRAARRRAGAVPAHRSPAWRSPSTTPPEIAVTGAGTSASSRRWSASSTARPQPGRAAVRRGGRRRHRRPDPLRARGDEALQRAEGRRRRRGCARSTPTTASRSSSGTLLFELEPVGGPACRLDRCSPASSSRTEARSPSA